LTGFKFYEKEIGSNFSNSLLINKSSNTEVSINLCEKSLDMPDFVSDKKIIFNKDQLATYEVINGSQINIYPKECSHNNTLIYNALHIPMGCLFAQKNYLVFHGAIAEKHNKCFMFVGDPGAGKSSLLMHLIKNGWNFITEDISILNDNNYRCFRSFPYIKLSKEIAEKNFDLLERTNIMNDSKGRSIYKLKKIAPENYGNLHKIFFLDWGQKNRIYTPSESTQLRLLLNYLIPSFQNKGSMMQTNIYSKLLNLLDIYTADILERPKSTDIQEFNETVELLDSYL